MLLLLYRSLHRTVCVLYAVQFEILTLHSMLNGGRDITLPGWLLLCGFILLCFIAVSYDLMLLFR